MSTPDDPRAAGDASRWRRYRGQLGARITEFNGTGGLATHGYIEDFTNPGISVDGRPPIRLPLSAHEDARALARLGDQSVPQTWEICAARIRFLNPAWPDFVRGIVVAVSRALGVPPATAVRAELDRSVLYAPFAPPKATQDVEKRPGTFAKLVICLPSDHLCGNVHLQYGPYTKSITTRPASPFHGAFMAWYSDMTDEIGVLVQGHRWILSYSLVMDGRASSVSASDLSAAAMVSQTQSLASLVCMWHRLDGMPLLLAYPLRYLYPRSKLGLDNLHSYDYHRVLATSNSCAWTGNFHIFLGRVGINGSTRVVNDLTTLAGYELSLEFPNGCPLPDRNLLGPLNSGNRVMIIVPKEGVAAAICGPDYPPSEPLGRLMTRLRSDYLNVESRYTSSARVPGYMTNNDAWMAVSLRSILYQLSCSLVETESAAVASRDRCLGHAAVSAVALRAPELFWGAVECTSGIWEPSSYYDLGRCLDVQALSAANHDALLALFRKGPTIGVCNAALRFFHQGQDEAIRARDQNQADAAAQMAYARQWHGDRLVETMHNTQDRRVTDVPAIMDAVLGRIVEYTARQQERLDNAVAYWITKALDNRPLVHALTVSILLEIQTADNGRRLVLRDIFYTLLVPTVTQFDLGLYCNYLEEAHPDGCSVRDDGAQGAFRTTPAGPIRALFTRATGYSQATGDQLLWAIHAQADNLDQDTAEVMLPALMAELLPVVDTRRALVRYCFQSLVSSYTAAAVREEPWRPTNWARPQEVVLHPCDPLDRRCEGCPRIKAFLEDPEAQHLRLCSTDDPAHVISAYPYLRIERRHTTQLTKTLEWYTWHYGEWDREADEAKAALEALPHDRLKEVLGHEYNALMAFRVGREW